MLAKATKLSAGRAPRRAPGACRTLRSPAWLWGSTEGPAPGRGGGHQDEIPCSHECTPKGAARSIPRAASDLGSAQVREERARATGHLERRLGTGEPPWPPAAWSSRPFGVAFAFLAAVTLPKRGRRREWEWKVSPGSWGGGVESLSHGRGPLTTCTALS